MLITLKILLRTLALLCLALGLAALVMVNPPASTTSVSTISSNNAAPQDPGTSRLIITIRFLA